MQIEAVDSAVLIFGAACVLAGIALVVLIAAPWKSVRAEPPLGDDIETRLLLGEDPSSIAADADRDTAGSAVAHDLATSDSDEE